MKKILFVWFVISLFITGIYGQQESHVKRSEIIEIIDGTKYYLHFVKQGETIYQLAKTYAVDIDEILKSNSNAGSELKPGNIIKIPFTEEKKEVKSEKGSEDGYILYTVEIKETLYGIARKFGVSVQQIRDLNPGMTDNLKKGQVIKVPSGTAKPGDQFQKPEQKPLTHTVQPGETLYSIAKSYNLSLAEIEQANPGITGAIKPGQLISIPQPSKNPEITAAEQNTQIKQVKEHIVAKGETVYSIARAYSVELDSIYFYNPGLTDHIFTGQVIQIPDKANKMYIWHKAEKNEKLQNIAEKYNVTYSEILDANPGIQKKIEKGQMIKIPSVKQEAFQESTAEELPDAKTGDRNCGNLDKNRNSTYKVALMLPFFLEQADSLVIDSLINPREIAGIAPLKFLQFYDGFMMAIDSMNKAGMNLSLFVYDVDNSPEKINSVLKEPALEKMDLIIGPFYGDSFKKMSEFAKTNKIKIVNPLSERQEIVMGNPYVFKVKPSASYRSELISSFIQKNFKKSNIILIRQNRYQFQDEASYVKNYLNGNRPAGTYLLNRFIAENLKSRKLDRIFSDDNLFLMDRLMAKINDSTYISNMVREIIFADDSNFRLRQNLSSVRHNVVIVYSDDKVFSQELMSQLNKLSDDYTISMFGCPEWEKFEDLETDQLVNLNVHWLSAGLVDYQSPDTKQWVTKFRNQFQTEPAIENYAFDGFDIGWYFLNALFLYGHEFENCLSDYHPKLLQTSYDFEQLKGNGFENKHWNIGAFENYRFIKAGR